MALCVPLVCALTLVAANPPLPRLAVLDVQPSGIDASYVPLLTEMLTTEIDKLQRFEVVAGRDLDAVLKLEKQREMLGCSDVACLAELGGALGVDQLVVANVGKLGGSYAVNIKLIDIRSVQTARREYEVVPGDIDVLVATMRRLLAKLLTAAPAPAPAPASPPRPAASSASVPASPAAPAPATATASSTRPASASSAASATAAAPAKAAAPSSATASTSAATPGTTTPSAAAPAHATTTATHRDTVAVVTPPATARPEVAATRTSSRLELWLPVGLGGAAVIVGGVGAYLGISAKQHYDKATDDTYAGGQLEIADGEATQRYANISFGVAGALAVGGVVSWLLLRDGSESAAPVQVTPVVGAHQASLSLCGSF